MSDTAQGVKTAQEYIEEYGLLKGSNYDDKVLNVNPQTGEVKGWDTAKNRRSEFSAAMKQIYTAGTGGARADLATMRNAFKGTAHQFDIAIKKLERNEDIELEDIASKALKQAEELLSRYIDFKKLCDEYYNELEAMLEYLQHYLDEALSSLKDQHPALNKAEKKIGRSLFVPVRMEDFPVFAQLQKDLSESSKDILATEERVERIKELTIEVIADGGSQPLNDADETGDLLYKAIERILAYEVGDADKDDLVSIRAEIERHLDERNTAPNSNQVSMA